MHPATLHRLQECFQGQAARLAGSSGLTAALLAGLGAALAEESSPVRRLFARFMQVTSDQHPTPGKVLLYGGALHHLALAGGAAGLARFCASCGGAFDPAADREAAVAEALAVTRRQADDLLEFMLAYPRPQAHEVAHSAAILLGALAALRRFPGRLALVEIGCSAGLNLLPDQYAYDFGGGLIRGTAALTLRPELRGDRAAVAALLGLELPVVSRTGLDVQPLDVTHPADVRALKACLFPDQAEDHARFDAAVAVARAFLGAGGRLGLRQGDLAGVLADVLPEVYGAMPAGTTLLVYHARALAGLPDAARTRVEAAIQSFSARLQPGKPLAWLQLEPDRPGRPGELELRLMTFSPDDPEDRESRRLATVHAHTRWIGWGE